jgi:DNA-binding GntR family transcriptional regulator
MTAPAPTPLEISSVEDGAYRALRSEIGRLELAPGQRLPLEEIAGRFQVSLTPVRHALRRLESEGLVVSLPRRGSRVAPLSVDELEEIQALRLGLETFLARLGAESITDDALAEMTAARDEMERAFRVGDLDAYLASFWSLRDACYRCADRPRLERTLQDQRVRVERYVLTLCRDPEAFADLRRGPDAAAGAGDLPRRPTARARHAARGLPRPRRRGGGGGDPRRAAVGAGRASAHARK